MKRTRENGAATSDPLPSDIAAMSVADRVTALRKLMSQHSIDAFVVPSEDAHMSEYVAKCDERRAFISGFDGSAGIALITKDAAYCWTDGRYFVQAANQLDPNVYKMMRSHEDPSLEEWAATNLPDGSSVYVDGRTISVSAMKRFRNAVLATEPSNRVTISSLSPDIPNLVDQVWGSARPAIPAATVFLHPIKYAGVSVGEKLEKIRQKMSERRATTLIVTGLDEVAWLLNLRGSDVDYNPVFWAYVVITESTVKLYVNETRFGEGLADHLKENSIEVAPYESLFTDLSSTKWDEKSRVWLDPKVCNFAIHAILEKSFSKIQILAKQGPIPLAKAKKCDTELDGMRSAHIRDGVALVKFLQWLENEVVALGSEPTECEAADRLDKFRSEQDLFVSLSFPTISSSGPNGAVIHYRPEVKTCRKITKEDVYLVDSGGQFRDGTTDVTRTMHFGEPSDWQKECFTRVLQGHIAIDTAVFPRGTSGLLLDTIARQALWRAGLDYKHGTGHGVGSYLNVHEGPHMISFKSQALATPLEAGFITSNEPGYYEENEFGIRIENLCIVVKRDVKGPPTGAEKDYYGMEHLTFAPMQARMIDTNLLSETERKWVDDYHAECYEKLSGFLQDDPKTLAWLRENTRPLVVN